MQIITEHKKTAFNSGIFEMVRVGMAKQKQQEFVVFVCNIFVIYLSEGNSNDRSESKMPKRGPSPRERVSKKRSSIGESTKKPPLTAVFLKWCSGTGSNRRHEDFQSSALPTELPEHWLTERFIKHIFPLVQLKKRIIAIFFAKFCFCSKNIRLF